MDLLSERCSLLQAQVVSYKIIHFEVTGYYRNWVTNTSSSKPCRNYIGVDYMPPLFSVILLSICKFVQCVIELHVPITCDLFYCSYYKLLLHRSSDWNQEWEESFTSWMKSFQLKRVWLEWETSLTSMVQSLPRHGYDLNNFFYATWRHTCV